MRTEDAYSIIDIVNEEYGVILTKGGNICISFALREPECYSLSVEDIDTRNNMWKEAFKFLPDGTYVHKQDFFLKQNYHRPSSSGTFLDRADARHFDGRLYMQHSCMLHFVLTGLKSLEKSYVANPLSFRENLHREDSEKFSDFLEAVNNSISIIKNLRDTTVSYVSGEDICSTVNSYSNLLRTATL